MQKIRTKHARRILVLLVALAMAMAVFSGCKKQEGGSGFNLGLWMQDPANAMQFQYIAVFDGEPYFGANEADQQWILDALDNVDFTPMGGEVINAVRPDFALAMNEPFLFFEFMDGALVVKAPSQDGTGYSYYSALLGDYDQLQELWARIIEMRQAHGAAEEDPGENQLAGGYSEERDVTPEDMEIFNQAMDDLVGVIYEPTKVATQVVAGMNYRFTATATPVIPDPEPYTVHITIYKPLQGPPELGDIEIIH